MIDERGRYIGKGVTELGDSLAGVSLGTGRWYNFHVNGASYDGTSGAVCGGTSFCAYLANGFVTSTTTPLSFDLAVTTKSFTIEVL